MAQSPHLLLVRTAQTATAHLLKASQAMINVAAAAAAAMGVAFLASSKALGVQSAMLWVEQLVKFPTPSIQLRWSSMLPRGFWTERLQSRQDRQMPPSPMSM